MLTDAQILTEVIQPERGDISPTVAREILHLKFSDATTSHIRDLLSGNNAGTITPGEQAELERYLRVGLLIDLFQAKARLSLMSAGDLRGE